MRSGKTWLGATRVRGPFHVRESIRRTSSIKDDQKHVWIDSDDVTYDVIIEVKGDFGALSTKQTYLNELVTKLNALPQAPSPELMEGLQRKDTVVTTALTWFLGARNTEYSPSERLLFMENAFNHTESSLIYVIETLIRAIKDLEMRAQMNDDKVVELSNGVYQQMKKTIDQYPFAKKKYEDKDFK